MEFLFNYRPDGQTLNTNDGEVKLMVIRRGPRGIVSVIQNNGPIVIWSQEEADSHMSDSEDALKQRTIDILNSK